MEICLDQLVAGRSNQSRVECPPPGFDNSGEWNGHTDVFCVKAPEV
jgi:hypothetical protein